MTGRTEHPCPGCGDTLISIEPIAISDDGKYHGQWAQLDTAAQRHITEKHHRFMADARCEP